MNINESENIYLMVKGNGIFRIVTEKEAEKGNLSILF